MTIGKIKCLDNQNGIALITVIMATALVAILAVSMTFAQHIDIRRTTNLLEGDKALILALGLEEWGRQVIVRDNQQGNNKDHLGENWALGLMPIATDNGIVSGIIVDLQGKINLNNLDYVVSPPDRFNQTRYLLERLFDFCEVEDSNSVVEALVDWIDTDELTRPGGAEDNEYLLHDPPYLAGNRPMKSPSELLLVEGVTPDNYACLKDHIAALPGVTDINVNTAGAVVIAMIGKISIDDATEIVSGRPADGYVNGVNDFLNDSKLAGSGISADGLGVESDYFMAQGQSTFGEAEIGLYSLIDRSSIPVKVVSRSIGTY
ncbi:MAG: type II secretion system minor pseudopilin GspK [Desulfobulbaceae bacterium]|nr:type II secretion system minor pseudopilin GspK [Desulfobulbaceae bacterium]